VRALCTAFSITNVLTDNQHVCLPGFTYMVARTDACRFPMDVPASSNAGLLTYAVLSFHLLLLIAFSLPRVTSVWGGTMLFRLKDLLDDTSGLMHAWESGGYSDDMICSAVMSQRGLRIVSPNTAVFLQPIEDNIAWARFWNYLCRCAFCAWLLSMAVVRVVSRNSFHYTCVHTP
jgi:hypothetical protein